MYHPIIQQSIGESHRANLLATADRERLARASRRLHENGSTTSADDRRGLFGTAHHRRALMAFATAMMAFVLLIAGEF